MRSRARYEIIDHPAIGKSDAATDFAVNMHHARDVLIPCRAASFPTVPEQTNFLARRHARVDARIGIETGEKEKPTSQPNAPNIIWIGASSRPRLNRKTPGVAGS